MLYKINQLAQIINGGTPSTENELLWNGNIPWITPRDLASWRSKYISKGERSITDKAIKLSSTRLVPENTVLLTSRAPIGYLAMARNPLCTNQGFKSLVCNESLIKPEFMYYCLSTKILDLISISSGSTFLELSTSSLANFQIEVPSLIVQQHIVDTIGSVDDLIEKYQEICAIIDDLLEITFVSIEPKKERLFFDVFSTTNGGSFKSDEYVNASGNYLITIKNVKDSGFDLSQTTYLDDSIANEMSKFKLNIGDVLMTMTGDIGRIGIVEKENCYLNQRVLKITCASRVFTYCFMKSRYFEILSSGHGSVQTNVGIAELSKLLVPYSDEQIWDFEEYMSFVFQKRLFTKIKIGKLMSLKRQLLERYFS